MDADHFDALAKSLSHGAIRRRVVPGLLGGALASLLAGLETGARPKKSERERDRVSDEKKKCPPCKKRKKGKCKKKKPDGTACPGGTCRSGKCHANDGVCANPGTCGDRPPCGPSGTRCSCVTTVEGEAFCMSEGLCNLQGCTTTSECPQGFACILGCCPDPICAPAC